MRHILTCAALVAATSAGAFAAAMAPISVPMTETKGSGESGTTTLTQTAAGLVVKISLKGGGADAQPAHIHKGKSCDFFDPKPTYPLANVVAGKSTTTLKNVKLAQVESGEYVVNVHKSLKDLGVYVACGSIPKT